MNEALRQELAQLIAEEPDLLGRTNMPHDQAVTVFAELLNHLIRNEPGAYARLGTKNQLPWGILPEKLLQLRSLSPTERAAMAGCCAYIEQTAMFPTGIDILLAEAR
jgi:hypothetical protein